MRVKGKGKKIGVYQRYFLMALPSPTLPFFVSSPLLEHCDVYLSGISPFFFCTLAGWERDWQTHWHLVFRT